MAKKQEKISSEQAEIQALKATLNTAIAENEQLKQQLDQLNQKLDRMSEPPLNAQRARFGRSSEKKRYILDEDQIALFNEAEVSQAKKTEEPTEETFTVKAYARKKKRTIDELAKDLPVEAVVFSLP